MAVDFLACDREQAFLMPLDPRDWLLGDYLAWFVLASVEEMDLAGRSMVPIVRMGGVARRSSRR
jgi:hypothetical protein